MFKVKIVNMKIDPDYVRIYWEAKFKNYEVKGELYIPLYDILNCPEGQLEKMIFEKIYKRIKEDYVFRRKRKVLESLVGKEFDEKYQLVSEIDKQGN